MIERLFNPWRYVIGGIIFFIFGGLMSQNKTDIAMHKMAWFVFGMGVFWFLLAGVAFAFRKKYRAKR